MATNSNVDEAIVKVLEKFEIKDIKSEQKKILDALLSKQDCMAVLPTGYGKSLPYQLLIPVRRLMDSTSEVGKVVVCSPLVALMEDQVDRLRRVPDIRAEMIGGSANGDIRIKAGEFDYLFASPEALVGVKTWRDMIHTCNIETIVVDEFHTIATWGEDEKTDKAVFRKWFSYLGELRSLCPKASVLALSATCTNKIKKRVIKVLNFDAGTLKQIQISPNKRNIKLVLRKVPYEIDVAFSWIVESMQENSLPRTLLYCVSISDCSKIYSYLVKELPQFSNVIDMYHSETPEASKNRVIADLKSSSSNLRLVICTNALGMGIDIKNCSSVILFGAPRQLVDIVQQIGRVGRDGLPSTALFLFNSYHLRHVDEDVKVFYKTAKCKREVLMSFFLSHEELKRMESMGHSCCDFCVKYCQCGSCSKTALETVFVGKEDEEPDSNNDDSDTEGEIQEFVESDENY